ncbi:gamma-glutamyltransferase [Aquabacter spiritensis]|uniref:Gamma-glutamyltranspeptidase/glutathione hydrolase n=1 Tax=Aquabacter spiritensis TaxID=933073 RepID=A0A4R3M0R1_9HYPH|nr:gamma-glutamyltransferase [Aquabacter spiritensis]TCT06176.1 gamma-glutamyltranspeptidase/glutathione hydrolase [Aquabacter spiritensis]
MSDPLLGLIRENLAASAPRIVTAAHPASAAAGAAMFAKGGNAFDAALAACFMDTVALPMKSGLFGDLVALVRRAGGRFEALVSVGGGCLALAEGAALERVGPRSVGVPGAPHGYSLLHGHARLDRDTLIGPAVRASEAGIAWDRVSLSYVVEARETLARLSPDNPYAPGGLVPKVGDIRRLPGLGRLLAAFARDGDALFESEIGAALIADLTARGGILRTEDFRQRPGQFLAPETSEIGPGCVLTATPFPTHGPRLIAAAQDVLRKAVAPLDAVRATRAAAKREGREHLDGGTTLVAAADEAGNAVVVLHSNSFPQFASGIVMADGLILNNRPGRGFDLTAPAGAANAPAAGKVPWTTVHAWSLERDGTLFVGATPGGVNQMPWNVQMVTELARGAAPADVVSAPRWALDAQDVLSAEPGALPPDVIPDKALGPLSLRACQQIIALAEPGGLHRAAVDPRTGCAVVGVY